MTVHDVAHRLPDIPVLRDRSRSLAMLDAILSPEWEYRYYSFNSRWGPDQELASMRNGSGDEYAVVFSPAGAWVRVFDHESPMSPWGLEPPRPWPGVLDSVPAPFQACVREPAFALEGVPMVTACLWRQTGDDRWHAGPVQAPAGGADPDGSGWLLELLLDGSPEAYRRFAEDYYESPVDPAAVREVYALRPLTQEIVTTLNGELSLADLAADVAQIGYPTAQSRATRSR
jgi:hypothetical protein